jgi:flagellar assembly protein FliH
MEIKRFGYGQAFPVRNREVIETAVAEDLVSQTAALRGELEAVRQANEDAVRNARHAGFAEGLAQGHDEAGGAMLASLDALHGALEEIDARLFDQVRTITQDAVETALAAAELLAGHAVSAAPTRALDEALGRVLEQVARGTPLDIHVHPSLVERMNACLAVRTGRERRTLTLSVVPDDSIAPSDGLIAWPSGGAVLKAAARRTVLLNELAPFLPVEAEEDKLSAPADFAADNIL